MPGAKKEQEWGLKFPLEKQEEMRERTKLKRLAIVEVGPYTLQYRTDTFANTPKRTLLSRYSALHEVEV